MNKIAVCIGTRPEFIKCRPLFESDTDLYVPVFVQQHRDILDSESITGESYTIPINDVGTDRLNNIMISILTSTVFDDKGWRAVLVQGDTAVAYGAALCAFHKKIPVIHLEAGLRTRDNENPWPEEAYRRMIDAITTIALCPSQHSVQNLLNEKCTAKRIEVVGNTSIDAIRKYNLTPIVGNTVLVTLHRRENWDSIPAFFAVLDELAFKYKNLKFVLPVHPNPTIRAAASELKYVHVINPLPHDEMCKALSECNCIISDSGGIQEEGSYLGKKIFCCRKITERTELEGDYVVYTPSPEDLKRLFEPQDTLLPSCTIYGEGFAHLKINAALSSILPATI